MGAIIVQNHNLHKIIMAFKNANDNDFKLILMEIKQIVAISDKVGVGLGKSGTFLESFVDRLMDRIDPLLRVQMLWTLRQMMEQSKSPRSFGVRQGLDAALEEIAQEGEKSVAGNIAAQILEEFKY